MDRKALLVLALITASFVLAVAAWASPVKSIPGSPVGSVALRAEYDAAVYPDAIPLWTYQSYAEMSEGFVALALLAFLLGFERPAWPWLQRRTASKTARYVGAALAFAGASLWVGNTIWGWIFPSPLYAADYVNGSQTYIARETGILIVYSGVGSLEQLAPLLVGICGLFLYRLDRGVFASFRDSVVRLGAPLVLFYELGLVVLLPLSMTDHVMSSLKLSEGGIQPLSNWFVLMVAVFLTAVGVWESRERLRHNRAVTPAPDDWPTATRSDGSERKHEAF